MLYSPPSKVRHQTKPSFPYATSFSHCLLLPALKLRQQNQVPLFPSLTKMECYSEEVDSRSCGELKKQKKTAKEEGTRGGGGGGGGGGKGGDGSSIEVVKRPRGRPPGSKNKLKPPVIITRESADPSPALRPHILEIPAGQDVAAALACFSRRRSVGISVLAATGLVANVTIRQPPVTADESSAVAMTFQGRFEILSISATFFPPSLPAVSGGGFSVSLAGPQGRVVGGMVAGPLVAAGTVVVVVAAFAEPTFHRLPVEDLAAGSASASPSGGGGDEAAAQAHRGEDDRSDRDEEAQNHYHHHHHRYDHHHNHGSSDGASIYAGHFPPHVLWNPTASSPHPPSPY